MFRNAEESHAHSLQTLNILYEYDDFMASISTMVDLGCGAGLDLEWWASRTTRDESAEPLNISCVGVDLTSQLSLTKKYTNVTYQATDFESQVNIVHKRPYDVLWCHNSFQYVIDPIGTLSRWWHITSKGGMLALILPQTTNVQSRRYQFTQESGCYYHHTLVSLIHMLAVSGWDCKSGFFKKRHDDPWLHAVVYKSDHEPMQPKSTSWYDLVELKLLPDSADHSIKRMGFLRQEDLILPWLDKSLEHLGNQ